MGIQLLIALNRRFPDATVIVGACAVGVMLLVIDIRPESPTVALSGAVMVSALIAFAVTDPLVRAGYRFRHGAVLACGLLVYGGIWLASAAIADHAWLALAAIGGSSLGAALLPFLVLPLEQMEAQGLEPENWVGDLVGSALATAYAAAAVTVGAWIASGNASRGDSIATLSIVEAAFDVMVFALFRERFRRLFEEEAEKHRNTRECSVIEHLAELERKGLQEIEDEEALGRSPAAGSGLRTVVGLALFGLAVLGALVTVIIAARAPLQLDESVRGDDPTGWALAIGGALVVASTIIGWFAVRRLRGRFLTSRSFGTSRQSVNPPWPRAGLAIIAALLVGVPPLLVDLDRHLPVAAVIGGLLSGALAFEALIVSNLKLQLLDAGWLATVTAISVAAAIASATWWLLGTGLWSGSGPAELWRAAIAVAATLGVCATLGIFAARLLAWSGTGEVFTPQPPADNAVQDHLMYAVLTLLAGVVPVSAIAHIEAHDKPLQVLSSLLFVPGLIGGVLWVMDNNRFHHRVEQRLQHPTRRMWLRATQRELHEGRWIARCVDAAQAVEWLRKYQAVMRFHGLFQNGVAKTYLALGMGILAAYSMRVV